MTVVSIIRVRRKATGKHTRMDTVMYGELVVPAFNYFYQFCNSDKKNVHVLKGLHCKNMWVVLTQLGYHSCNLRIKNNPCVFVYALYNNMRVDFGT